ncbi:MAG: multidrug effflux MFS transporter [Pseudomonadota bacterium]
MTEARSPDRGADAPPAASLAQDANTSVQNRKAPSAARPTLPVPAPEFIMLVGALMALNAIAIDIMLPALGQIGAAFQVQNDNDRQLIVVAYVIGLGLPQLLFGPMSDRFGRRNMLLFSLIGYSIFGLLCVFAQTFEQLLLARGLQGAAAAGARVAGHSIVRDVYSGRAMARVLSFAMMVLMAAPIIAPGVGQLVLFVAGWRMIFLVLVIVGLGLFAWIFFRVPETLPAAARRSIDVEAIASAYKMVLTTRVTCGYMMASGVVFGCLFSFISAAEQVFLEVYDLGASFTFYFAGVAIAMAASSLMNANLVERIGMRRLSHGALIALALISVLNAALSMAGFDGLWVFFPLMACTFFLFSLIGANFNALAMEPLGDIAGTAAAAYGFVTTILSGVLGAVVARGFDGTTTPLLIGFTILSFVALAIVFVTEKGRLFQAR